MNSHSNIKSKSDNRSPLLFLLKVPCRMPSQNVIHTKHWRSVHKIRESVKEFFSLCSVIAQESDGTLIMSAPNSSKTASWKVEFLKMIAAYKSKESSSSQGKSKPKQKKERKSNSGQQPISNRSSVKQESLVKKPRF